MKREGEKRVRALWRQEESAIDTDKAIAINEAAVRELGNVSPGWGRLRADVMEHLRIDVSPLCAAFDELNRGYLPRGMVHLWMEPAIAHFTQHVCSQGPAEEDVCAFARALYILGVAAEQQKMAPWRRLGADCFAQLARDQSRMRDNTVRNLESFREMHGNDPRGERLELIRTLENCCVNQREWVQAYENEVEKHAGAQTLIADREASRPALVFAEAELLAARISPRRVSELIEVHGNSSDAVKQVRSRAQLDTFELQLAITR